MFKAKQILGINSKEVTGFMVFPQFDIEGKENYGFNLPNTLAELENTRNVFAVDVMTDEESTVVNVFVSYNDAWLYSWKYQMAKFMNGVIEKFKYAKNPEMEKKNLLKKMDIFEQQCLENGVNLPNKVEVKNGKVVCEVVDMATWTYTNGNDEYELGELPDVYHDSVNITPVPLVIVLDKNQINNRIMKNFKTNVFFKG